MAKLMAPNIRIDWYPEGHFADPENPTLGELNSGYNLSPAIVTGYTLDFTDTDTVDVATIYDNQTSELFTHSSYEANLQFFLAPRGSSSANESSYRMAEELFYHNQFAKGYLVKRFGYKWNVEFQPGQKIDIFYVQSTIPKVSVEEGKPILLEVTYIPLGLGVSRGWAGQIKFSWLGEPHNSPSVKLVDGVEVARNWHPTPQGEEIARYLPGTGGEVEVSYITNATDGPSGIKNYRRATIITPAPSGSGAWNGTASLYHTEIQSTSGDWVAFTYYVRYIGKSDEVYYTPRIYFYDSSGSNISFHTKSQVYYPDGEWVRVVMTHEIPVNTHTVGFWNYFVGGENAPSGSTVDFSGMHVSVGNSEQEALRQVETYFDGDSIYNG